MRAMIPRGLFTLLVLIGLLGFPQQADARRPRRNPPPVRYEVSVVHPARQYVDVTMEVDKPRGKRTRVAMPAWAPGSYLIRDFGKHVYELRAEALEGGELPVTRIDKQTWEIEHRRRQAFRVRYRLWADDLSVRTNHLDDQFAFLSGSATFLYVVDELERGGTLSVRAPDGWGVYSALPDKGGVHPFTDYDELADSPMLLGPATRRDFTVGETRFDYVFFAPQGTNADLDRLVGDARRVVESFHDLMGGLPFDHYTFFAVADPAGGGGLEHMYSTGMILRPWSFDGPEGYAGARRLLAHEFFHAWNVKRIHDEKLGPFDYQREVYTDLLWFHEGFTETMETRAILHAGLMSSEDYLGQLAGAWTRHLRRPGRNAAPIAQLSRDAWIKSYQPEANHRNTTISYYSKGDLIGVALDLELRLRAQKNGQRGSLEGLFRRLMAMRDPGEDELPIDRELLTKAASAEAGEDMTDFFARYVWGTEELPLPALLERIGIEVEGLTQGQLGGEGTDPNRTMAWTGLVGRGDTVSSIDPGSPAQDAGLMIGDRVVAVNGLRVDGLEGARARFRDAKVGGAVELTFFRGDRLLRTALKIAENPYLSFRLREKGDVAPEIRGLRDHWLMRSGPSPAPRAGEADGADGADGPAGPAGAETD